jgi:hypothetical protein
MRRISLFVLVATVVIVAAVGVALATTRGTQASGTEPAAAGDVSPSQPAAKASATAPPQPRPKAPTHAAVTTGGDKNCWDDCGDPGGSDCGSNTGTGHSSTSVIDDDGDGDGGDCGGGD